MKSLKGTLTIKGRLRGILYAPSSAEGMTLQEKTVTPTTVDITVLPDGVNTALMKVTVKKIPSNYGRITWDGEKLTIE